MPEKPKLGRLDLGKRVQVIKEKTEPRKLARKEKESLTEELKGYEEIVDYFKGSENDFTTRQLLVLAKNLQSKDWGVFDEDFPAELKESTDVLDGMDMARVDSDIAYLEGQAREAGLSVEEVLDVLDKDEDESIREQAEAARVVLEEKTKIEAILEEMKPQLLDLVKARFTDLKDNTGFALGKTEEELAEFEEAFEVKEQPQDYETMARGLKQKYVDNKFTGSNHNFVVSELQRKIKEYKSSIANRDYTAERALKEAEKELDRVIKEKQVKEFVWSNYFDDIKTFLDEECGDDETKKSDWLHRLTGASEPKEWVVEDHSNWLRLNRELVKEFGEGARSIIEKYLEAKVLLGIKIEEDFRKQDSNKSNNADLVRNYYNMLAGVREVDFGRLQQRLQSGETTGYDSSGIDELYVGNLSMFNTNGRRDEDWGKGC